MADSARATFSELTEGRPFPPMTGRTPADLAAAGFVESEWAVSGEAASYAATVTPADGRFELTDADTAPYATRVLVRRPADPAAFSGVVLVEWLNVSGGQDAAPDFTYLADEILRAGHAWVGVSAQFIAVEGGDAAVGMGGQTTGLRATRPERYGDLHHPGDAYAYDIITQVGRYARDPHTGTAPDGPLGDLRPQQIIAVGESQSAFALTSYVNGVHARAGVFDAFLLHSRGAGFLPFDDRGRGADIRAALSVGPARLREDVGAPVLIVQAEGDLLGMIGSLRARQPDSEWVTTWEIAGQAHADLYQLGEFAQFVDCNGPINSGQQVFVLRAGLRHLVSWAGGGARPPAAPPVEIDDDDNATTRHPVTGTLGNSRGGVRTPVVDAPVEHLTGEPDRDAQPMCMLLGRTLEVDEQELRERWESQAQYLAAYAEATDRLIKEGFLLADDREEILADARPERITW
ncbi:alpha/beta hydrolase domain-containing protein [Dietzia aurantiaca]|uniref:Alpha/beta hydrolase domain-containing protein n=1 Tax=Dietzia aurantiaca TaxID=983873 RepID=A0ABV9PVD2_9ACTN